jgi:2-(1,2-epoxy-1,2-dihydrophenyl)acetyl-CoA isomerase
MVVRRSLVSHREALLERSSSPFPDSAHTWSTHLSDPKITVEKNAAVGIIYLNDPTVLNAMSIGMVEELDRAVDQVAASARALILTGRGRAFSAGANLSAAPATAAELPDAGAVLESHINPLLTKLRNLPIPWISAVRGPAAGVGCSLALAGDLIVASETAYFLQAFCRIGLVPDGGSSFLLTRAVGRARATEMMLLGERLPAVKALEWGLINRVVPDSQLDAVALEQAQALADGPTRSLGMIRQLVWSAIDSDWEETLATERRLQQAAGRTADHLEGVAAFLAKRPPRFAGN